MSNKTLPRRKMKERYYYKQLSDRVKSKFKCFEVKSAVGTEDVGQVDIAGVRDIGGWSSGQIELLIFEVKKASEKKGAIAHFGRHIGQTLGYSIIGNRCYLVGVFLPDERGFSDEQKILANHFGVGLIEAMLDESAKEVVSFSEVLTSNYFSPPIQHKMDKVLLHLGVLQCCFCRVHFRKDQLKRFDISRKELEREYLFSKRKHKQMYICRTCAKNFNFKQRRKRTRTS